MNNLFIDLQLQLSLQQTKLLIEIIGFERLKFSLNSYPDGCKTVCSRAAGSHIYDSPGDQQERRRLHVMPRPQSEAPSLHLERARDYDGSSETVWCSDYWRRECLNDKKPPQQIHIYIFHTLEKPFFQHFFATVYLRNILPSLRYTYIRYLTIKFTFFIFIMNCFRKKYHVIFGLLCRHLQGQPAHQFDIDQEC